MATYYNGRHIVLTGASSGIGLALARHLSARGAVLLATGARAKADLPSEFPDIQYVSIDMAKPDCADKLAGAVADLGWLGIDLLILNAGTGRQAPVENETAQTIENGVAVNLAAPIRIAHRFAEPLIESAGQLVDDEDLREAMKEKGLGTPATRAAIIEGLIKDKYVVRQSKELIPSAKAKELIESLSAMKI